MKTDNFEDILKGKFESHSITPPPSIMLNIEKQLEAMEATPLAIQPKRKTTLLWSSVAAAASILIGVLLLNLGDDIDTTSLANADTQIEQIIDANNAIQPIKQSELITYNDEKPSVIRDDKNTNKSVGIKTATLLVEQKSSVATPQASTATKSLNKQKNTPKAEIKEIKEKKTITRESVKSYKKPEQPYMSSPRATMARRPQQKKLYAHVSSNSLATGVSKPNEAPHIPYTLSTSKGDAEGQKTDVASPKNLNHKTPISIGAHVGFNLTDKLSIESGLVYSKLNSSYETTIDNGTNFKFEQNLDYLGIPISLRYKIAGNNVGNVYTKGGIMVERAISANRSSNISGENLYEKFAVKGVQTSINFAVGGEIKIISKLGLFLEPGISYYFDNNQPDNYRTNKQFAFNLSAGLRFLIN